MVQEIIEKNKLVAVIGMGYVGLPIALEFAKKTQVIGFDINESRIASLKRKIDPSGEIAPEEFNNRDITFSSTPDDLR